MQIDFGHHTVLNHVHGTSRMSCKAAPCNEQAKFIFKRCSHAVCGCCTRSSKGFVVDSGGSKDVFVCPICIKLFNQYSSWITPELFFRSLAEVFYCMRCCKQEAIHRLNCGHLLCLRCLTRIDINIDHRVCNVLGCKTMISKEDTKNFYQQATVSKMWTSLKLPRNQVCDIFCQKKAVLLLKSCGHGCCYSCIQTKLVKQIEPILSLSGEKVFRCKESFCPTTISETVLNQYLLALSTIALTAAFTLEISTEECYRCRNKSDTEFKVRNKACGLHHAFCLECLSGNKTNTVFKPFLHCDGSGSQTRCLVPDCDSTTPILALTAFLETLTGNSCKVEMFLRKAVISEMCTNCSKQYAYVARLACSHGLCRDCVKVIMKKRKYDMCRGDFDTCRNIVPISVFENFFQGESLMLSLNDSDEHSEQPKIKLVISVDESIGSLTLSAVVTSSSATISHTWIHNNHEIPVSKSRQKFFEDVSQPLRPILVINNLQREDAGSYCLKVENDNGVTMSDEVLFPLPSEKTKIFIKKIPNKEDKSVILQAELLTKWPVKRLRWQRNRMNLVIINAVMKYVENISDEHNPVLTIQNFEKSDEGKYRLLAESIDGQIVSEEIDLNVSEVESPDIAVEFSINKKEKSVKFIANIPSSLKGSKIRWTKDDKDIDSKQYRKYFFGEPHDSISTLVVYNITKEDQGEYKAIAEGKPMIIRSHPAVFAIPEDALGVSLDKKLEGKSLQLCADIITDDWPIIQYIWQKDGKKCQPGGRCQADYSVPNHPRLVFPNASETDNGLYTVTVETLGEVRSSASVQVYKHAESVKPTKPKEEYNPDNYTDPQSNGNSFLQKSLRNSESKIIMVKHPYTCIKVCRICHEIAVAEIEKCLHGFCLNCIAVLTIQLPSEHTFFTCTDGCKSWISLDALDLFLERPCAIQLEAPMYFQLKPNVCGSCDGDGIIKAQYCNHSLCLDCLKRCKPDEQCEISSCQNMKLPPKYYYEYLISSLCSRKIDKELPFVLSLEKSQELFSNEFLECSVSNCTDKAIYMVIRCGHKLCARCVKNAEKKPIKGYGLTISRCPGPYCCEELFPLSLCCPPGRNSGSSEASHSDHGSVATVSGKHMDAEKEDETKKNTALPQKGVNRIDDVKGKRKMEKDLKEHDDRQSNEKVVKISGSRGLRNIGFSCYRNSILQILAETPYFLEYVSQSLIEKKKDWICSLCLILEGIRTNTTEENIDQLHQFHHEFNKSNPEYHEYEQEDCLSFLTSLLNGIQDACTENRGATKDPVDLFRGKWRDKYVCQKCSAKEYYNDSEFFYLPLPYTEKKKKDATIGSCFLGLLVEEEIDMFSCSTCGFEKIKKQLDIVHFPLILVLQFSKIQQVDSSDKDCSFEKRRNFVKFWETFEGLKNTELKKKIGEDTLRPYRLFGVVVHWGSEKSGHYICFVKVKGEQKWKRCDDSYVDDISLKSVLKSNAYLLFYEKCESKID